MGLVRTKYLPALIHTANLNKHILTEYKKPALRAKRAYIDLNNPSYQGGLLYVMMFDIDGGNAPLAWHDSMPFQPAFFAGKWKSGVLERPHVVVNISSKYPVKKTSRKQMKLFHIVYDEIASRLRGEGCKVDNGQKPTIKNPDSGAWDVIRGDQREWTLYELAEALDIDLEAKSADVVQFRFRPAHTASTEYAGLGRNCELFETVRLSAYAHKQNCINYEELYRYVYDEAKMYNLSFAERLQQSEMRSIAKSIARWTWYRYEPKYRQRNHGAAGHLVSQEQERKLREALGAYYSSAKKPGKMRDIVEKTRAKLIADGKSVTKKGVAKASGLALNTVKKYWDNETDSIAAEVIDILNRRGKINDYSELKKIVERVKSKYNVTDNANDDCEPQGPPQEPKEARAVIEIVEDDCPF